MVLGYTEAELQMCGTGYQFIHAADMLYCAENHVKSKSPFLGTSCPPLRYLGTSCPQRLMSGLGYGQLHWLLCQARQLFPPRMLCFMPCCDALVTAGSVGWGVVKGI